MLPIVFGYPMPEAFAAAERGEIALGGCVVSAEDPTHRCTACGQDIILDVPARRRTAADDEHARTIAQIDPEVGEAAR
jgi:hypothetical protein